MRKYIALLAVVLGVPALWAPSWGGECSSIAPNFGGANGVLNNAEVFMRLDGAIVQPPPSSFVTEGLVWYYNNTHWQINGRIVPDGSFTMEFANLCGDQNISYKVSGMNTGQALQIMATGAGTYDRYGRDFKDQFSFIVDPEMRYGGTTVSYDGAFNGPHPSYSFSILRFSASSIYFPSREAAYLEFVVHRQVSSPSAQTVTVDLGVRGPLQLISRSVQVYFAPGQENSSIGRVGVMPTGKGLATVEATIVGGPTQTAELRIVEEPHVFHFNPFWIMRHF